MSSDTNRVDLRLVSSAALIQVVLLLMLQKHGLLDLLAALQYRLVFM